MDSLVKIVKDQQNVLLTMAEQFKILNNHIKFVLTKLAEQSSTKEILEHQQEAEVFIEDYIDEAIDESVDLIATSFKDNLLFPMRDTHIDAICRLISQRLKKVDVIW